MQNHYLPVQLPDYGHMTTAYWARKPSGHALVFVHGFRGKAEETWEDFPGQAQARPEAHGVDLIFYGYESTKRRARIHALSLMEFVAALATSPLQVIADSLELPSERPDSFSYRRVTLVAHSLGAVICRQMLLDARRDKLEWRHLTELALFAPAHMGADVLRLEKEIPRPGFTWIVAAAVRYKVPILLDLEPGCQTLQLLLDETREALRDGNEPCLIARCVVFGSDDKVVSPNQFASDPVPRSIPRKGHIDVCKPTSGYDVPISEVLSTP